jgi:hypothetical protein
VLVGSPSPSADRSKGFLEDLLHGVSHEVIGGVRITPARFRSGEDLFDLGQELQLEPWPGLSVPRGRVGQLVHRL